MAARTATPEARKVSQIVSWTTAFRAADRMSLAGA